MEEKDESSRCDSFSRRCNARSFLRFAASVPSSSVGDDWRLMLVVDNLGSEDGGFEDLVECQQIDNYLVWISIVEYHERLHLLFVCFIGGAFK